MPEAALSIDVQGVEKLAEQAMQVPNAYEDELTDLFDDYAFEIERTAKDNLDRSGKPGVDDGRLRSSVRYVVHDAFASFFREGPFFVVFSRLAYAIYVHEGTGKYAREGEGRQTPWVYFDEKRGEFYTTEGIPPNPFLEDAFQKHKGPLLADLKALNANISSVTGSL